MKGRDGREQQVRVRGEDSRDGYGSLALPETGDVLVVLVEVIFIRALQMIAIVRVLVVLCLCLGLVLDLVRLGIRGRW